MAMYRWVDGILLLAIACVTMAFSVGPRADRIVFVSDRDGNREIYAMGADGANQTNLSQDPGRDQAPALSPDGLTVAFLSDRTGVLGVWTMGIDGQHPRLVLELPEADFGLEWSPDGRTLALSVQRPVDGTHDVALLDLATTRLTMVTDTEGIEELTPAWAPDGRRLYYIQDNGSGSMLVAHTLATDETYVVVPVLIGTAAFPKIAPDGRHAVLRSRDAEQFDVLLVDLEDGQVENLTRHEGNDWGAVWSRDGTRIVFASDRDGDMEIYLLTMRDRVLRQLTHNAARDWMPSWQ